MGEEIDRRHAGKIIVSHELQRTDREIELILHTQLPRARLERNGCGCQPEGDMALVQAAHHQITEE